MKHLTRAFVVLVVAGGLLAGGCGGPDGHAGHNHDHGNKILDSVTTLVCVIQPVGANKCKGVATFVQDGDKIKITVDVEGLTPNQKHAIHVHEFGDIRDAAKALSTGGHYNPEGHKHGGPHEGAHERHAGDLGNLSADKDGKAHYELTVDNVSLAGASNPIIGRSIIIHEKADDWGQPTGNAGPRIGTGVIGVAKK